MTTEDSDSPGPAPVADPWITELVAHAPDPETLEFAHDLSRRAPASYRERTTPEQAALDARELRGLFGTGPATGEGASAATALPAGDHRFTVRALGGERFHIRRLATRPVELTALLPVLESFGLVVEESVPYRFELRDGLGVSIDDVGVHLADVGAGATTFDPGQDGQRLVDALDAVVAGRTEIDRLNVLVAVAGLSWRQVSLLRAYANYWTQCEPAVPTADVEEALVAFPAVSGALVAYFDARFDPAADGAEAPARAACVAQLAKVPLLRWDRALRVVLSLVEATVRTNFFQPTSTGGAKETVTLKLESASVPQLRAPLPRLETWVHAPGVEGIHLRAGLVARGGIRWSERPEDFRTEVLDLMVAQVKKNAIIVPTGAKGGFVCRTPGRPSPADVRRCYAVFVSSLLDVTDGLEGGKVAGPPGVLAHDGPDPYLVVAADKGTAALSDLANELSAAHGFWLGDAFASGGSHGYNHKAMGITARGAWVAVRRHFHQLGIDVQQEPVLVAGVGDMSGDVFGNGMLLSEAIMLVAAFDHRHIFVDPSPDPAVSYAERRRLAALPTSSWADYSPELISAGGGVWARDAKEVTLSPEARRALGLDRERVPPPELISAILEAPVDLLWFGGVGTFVKAAEEPDQEVGDRANDEVRVSADRVRARVIGEGGNLGITQRARIRYSRRGGRINTDFIDNAAGVATSDREVNLKILLSLAIEEGRLDARDRDAYLERAQDEVAAEVLRQVDHSVAALNRAVPDSADQLDAYAALIDVLESSGRVDRAVEALPDTAEFGVRRAAGAGMIRPELAVLLAYAKSDLVAGIEQSPIVADPSFAEAVESYFPEAMRTDFGDLIAKHRLYDQILATQVAGEIVDRLGTVWAHETAAELGVGLDDVAAAYWAARHVLGAATPWAELDARWADLPADAEGRLHHLVADAVANLARAYLRRAVPVRPASLVAEDLPIAEELCAVPPGENALDELLTLGADRAIAESWTLVAARARVGDVGPAVRATGRSVDEVLAAYHLVDDAAGVPRMLRALQKAPTHDRWQSWLTRATFDDLADWRRAAAVEALRSGADPADPVVGWAAGRDASLAAARRLLLALDAQGTDPTTVVAVAVRRLPRVAADEQLD
ncbi:MAG TPA: NAD-glutamate dehydrogenase domain-containing protein [Acidimicrobiales bacterium]|nr:NAD-glutamate dehydrogenase domain-containing protein [Acidimicrobiales bacterium]